MFDLTMAATSTSVYRTARRYERYATDLDGIFIVFFSYDAAFNPSSRETLGGYSMLSRLCIWSRRCTRNLALVNVVCEMTLVLLLIFGIVHAVAFTFSSFRQASLFYRPLVIWARLTADMKCSIIEHRRHRDSLFTTSPWYGIWVKHWRSSAIYI